jgi:hypothetical protein
MATYEGNDLRDAVEYERYAQSATASPAEQAKTTSMMDTLRESTLGRNSYVFNLILAGITEYSGSEPPETAAGRAIRGVDKGSVNFRYTLRFDGAERPFNVDNSDRDEVVHAVVLEQGGIALTAFDAALTTFMKLAAEYDFTPVVVYVPSAYTAYADFVRFEDPKLQELMPRYSESVRRYFAEAAPRFGFKFLDATPAMQQAARALKESELLYFATNVHLTPAGHRVLADATLEYLETLSDTTQASTVQTAGTSASVAPAIAARPPARPECRGS